jgi:hypothetical protein
MDNKKASEETTQGFNEDELADIMSEIEGLERDLNAEAVAVYDKVEQKQETNPTPMVAATVVEQVSVTPVSSENHAKETDHELMEEFVQEPIEKVLPFTHRSPTVAPMKTEKISTDYKHTSTMDFTVAGNMAVKLSFNVSGQTIHLTMDESAGLVIEMHGGAKFCLPLTGVSEVKKKAS